MATAAADGDTRLASLSAPAAEGIEPAGASPKSPVPAAPVAARLFEGFFWVEPERLNAGAEFKTAKVVWSYPSTSAVGQMQTDSSKIPQFCFPDMEKMQIEKLEACKNEFFTFTLTEANGTIVYGVCLRALFKGEAHRHDVKRRPRHCLCITTRHPFFALLRIVLLQVHSLALLDGQGDPSQSSAKLFLDSVYGQVLPEAYSGAAGAGLTGNKLAVRRATIPRLPRDFFAVLPKAGGHGLSVPILPLLECLGVKKFLLLLSAALCERRIIFLADDVEKLSSAVLATASMLQPFEWQHIFIPLLPSTMFDYIAAPMPYMIGVRRYLEPKLDKVALEDVIVVDADKGTLVVKNGKEPLDFVGKSGSTMKQASENVDALFKAGQGLMNMLLGHTNDSSMEAGPRDLMTVLVGDLRSLLASKPGSNNMRGVASGIVNNFSGAGKSVEEAKVLWTLKGEKTLRDSLLLLFVYLFADMEEAIITTASLQATAQANRGVAKNGNAFGQGDSRAAFDLAGFLAKRAQMGDSRELQAFLGDFQHSQMFERFCHRAVTKLKAGTGIGRIAAPISPQEVMQRRRASSTGSSSSSSSSADGAAGADDEIFEVVCRELRLKQLVPSIANVKVVIGIKSTTRVVGDLHTATLQYTDGSNTRGVSEGNTEMARMHQQQTIDRICADASQSDQFNKIMRTIALRLEACRASGAKGQSGILGLRALVLLRVLLISGPHCTLSYALDFIPTLRALMHPLAPTNKSALSDALSAAVSSPPVDVVASAAAVMLLLLDHDKLRHQRLFATLVKDNAIPHLTSGNQRMRGPVLVEFSKLHATLRPPAGEEDRAPPALNLSVPVLSKGTSATDDEDDEDMPRRVPHVSLQSALKLRRPKGKKGAKGAVTTAGATTSASAPPSSAPSSAVVPPLLLSSSTQGGETARKVALAGGSSSSSSSSMSSSAAAAAAAKVYQRYCPSKVKEVPALLDKYRGSEAQLLERLGQKYNPAYARQRVEGIYRQHNPSKMGDVPGLLQKYRGKEGALIEAMEKKYLAEQ